MIIWAMAEKGSEIFLFPTPARPWSGPTKLLGHPSWPKEAARRVNAHCLRPTCPDEVGEAEFARSSGHGLRRVNNFVQDAKGMCT